MNRTQLAAQYVKEPLEPSIGSDLEPAVANIYRELLSVPEIGPGDNFFALGGDSLRATQVINRVRAQFEVNLSIRYDLPQSDGLGARCGSRANAEKKKLGTRQETEVLHCEDRMTHSQTGLISIGLRREVSREL